MLPECNATDHMHRARIGTLANCGKNNANDCVRCIVNGKWITSRIKCFEFNSIFIGLMTSLWYWCCYCVANSRELRILWKCTNTWIVCCVRLSKWYFDVIRFLPFCPCQCFCFLTARSIDINWIIWRWIIIKSAHRFDRLPHPINIPVSFFSTAAALLFKLDQQLNCFYLQVISFRFIC